jgi:hypothetical protein
MVQPMKGILMRKAMLTLAALAATMVAGPLATAQASYKVTSIKQIAPNTLKYLLSHYTGAASLESKLRAMEVKVSGKALILEGPEGKEGPAGATGARGEAGAIGPQGDPGDEGAEGAEGKASIVAGPAGPQGPAAESITGPEGPEGKEGAASNVAGPTGPQGETGPQGPRGEPCKVSLEPACASTVPGPRGEKGETGATGAQGPAVQFETGTWTSAVEVHTNGTGSQTFAFTNTAGRPLEVFVALNRNEGPQQGEIYINVGGTRLPKIQVAVQSDSTSFVVPTGQEWKLELSDAHVEYAELPL